MTAQPFEDMLQMNWNETTCVCLRALASRRRQNPPFQIQKMRIQSESRAENSKKIQKMELLAAQGKSKPCWIYGKLAGRGRVLASAFCFGEFRN